MWSQTITHLESRFADFWAPLPEILIQEVWDGDQASAFPTSSQVMLTLLVFGPHMEWHWHVSPLLITYWLELRNVATLNCERVW